MLIVGAQQSPQCSSNYNSYGYCYTLIRNQANWTDATAYCERTGGKLVGIYDNNVQEQVRTLLVSEQFSGSIWTGGKQEEPDDMIGSPQSLWRWVKG